jgi:hypothetical protein
MTIRTPTTAEIMHDYVAEIDRLRAEVARLKGPAQDLIDEIVERGTHTCWKQLSMVLGEQGKG